MAIPSLVQAFTAATQNNVSASASIPAAVSPAAQPQAGDIVVVCPWGFQSSGYDVNLVTDSIGTSFTRVVAGGLDSNARPLGYVGVLASTPTVDTYSVTVDHAPASGNYGKSGVAIFRATGGSGWQIEGTPIAAQGAGSGAGTVTISGLSTTLADAVVLTAIALTSGNNPAGITVPSGFTLIAVEQDGVNSMPGGAAYKIVSAAGAQSATWTYTSTFTSSRILFAISNPDAGAAPTISSTSSATPAQGSSLTITGTNFGATQGTGGVTIGGAAQTVTAWSDTSITITVSRGASKYGVGVNLVVTNGSGSSSTPYALTSIQPQSGWAFVNVGTPNTTAAYRVTASPDVASGDQAAWGNLVGTGSVTLNSDLTFSADAGVTAFDVEFWTSGDGWGSVGTQTIVTVQLLAPASDVAAGAWTANVGGTLAASLDELIPSDSDYIATLSAGDSCTVAIAAGTDPVSSSGHKVRYRLRGDGLSGATVELLQGASVIATWTHDPAPTELTTYEQVLSGPQADSITDYSALRVRITEI